MPARASPADIKAHILGQRSGLNPVDVDRKKSQNHLHEHEREHRHHTDRAEWIVSDELGTISTRQARNIAPQSPGSLDEISKAGRGRSSQTPIDAKYEQREQAIA